MATAQLRIASSDPSSPKLVTLRSQIGNAQQTASCDVDSITAAAVVNDDEVHDDTLAEANAAALAQAEIARGPCQWTNDQQDCPDGFAGTPIAPGEVISEVNKADANAQAAAMLVCTATEIESPFAPALAFTPTDMEFDSQGRLYVCGGTNLVRFLATGVVDPDWTPPTITGGNLQRIAIDASDRILGIGTFTTVNGSGRTGMFRMGDDSLLDATFNPVFSPPPELLANVSVAPDGKIYASTGGFVSCTVNGGSAFRLLTRLNDDGTEDTVFHFGTSNYAVHGTLPFANGVYIFGSFTAMGGAGQYAAKLDLTGAIVAAFDVGTFYQDTDVYFFSEAIFDEDGDVVTWGQVKLVNNASPVTGVMRFDPTTGTRDPTLQKDITGSAVTAVVQRADGSFLAFGAFSVFDGVSKADVAKMSSIGTVDAGFSHDSNALVSCAALAPNLADQVAFGGTFSTIGGVGRTKIAAINSDDTLV